MFLMDCTLRDGANIIGKGFDKELTVMMLEGLIRSNIKVIEMGNCLGLGAYEANNSISPLNDKQYLDLIKPYLSQAEIGMFIGIKNVIEANVSLGAAGGLHFLRIGANAGDGGQAEKGVKLIKSHGMKCRYAMMKGYILTAEDLAEEATLLESFGVDEITIMDSAGTMIPSEVEEYITAMTKRVNIPIGFHGHNNLGLSVANTLAAALAGATVLDCGLMGMARSAGNSATELLVAVFQKIGYLKCIDLITLLHFIDQELAPAMAIHGYKAPVTPLDLVYGLAGCHSSFEKLYQDVALNKGVDLYPLIIKVSELERKAPSKELIESIADQIRH